MSSNDTLKTSVSDLMANSFLYWDYKEFEKELTDQFPELFNRQLMLWFQFGAFVGAILMLSQPESIGCKALIRKLSTSTFGKKVATLAFKYGPNRIVPSTTGVEKLGSRVVSVESALKKGFTVQNAFRENMFYIVAGLMSDSDAIKDLLALANQKVMTPALINHRVDALVDYSLAMFNQQAADKLNMFEDPGSGLSLVISYDEVLKSLWMIKSYQNFEKGRENLALASKLETASAALCGLLRDGFEDSKVINITTFNEQQDACFGGLRVEAYNGLSLIPFLARRFDQALDASPLTETRNSMLISWANGVLLKSGATRLKLFVRPLAKTADYLDFEEALK